MYFVMWIWDCTYLSSLCVGAFGAAGFWWCSFCRLKHNCSLHVVCGGWGLVMSFKIFKCERVAETWTKLLLYRPQSPWHWGCPGKPVAMCVLAWDPTVRWAQKDTSCFRLLSKSPITEILILPRLLCKLSTTRTHGTQICFCIVPIKTINRPWAGVGFFPPSWSPFHHCSILIYSPDQAAHYHILPANHHFTIALYPSISLTRQHIITFSLLITIPPLLYTHLYPWPGSTLSHSPC